MSAPITPRRPPILAPFFTDLKMKVRGDLKQFNIKRAGPRAKAALFALKNVVATGNTTSYIHIGSMFFRVESLSLKNKDAVLVNVLFTLQDGHQTAHYDDSQFQFSWSNIEMRPMGSREERAPHNIGQFALSLDEAAEHEGPYAMG
jgi:hypothetical protein